MAEVNLVKHIYEVAGSSVQGQTQNCAGYLLIFFWQIAVELLIVFETQFAQET